MKIRRSALISVAFRVRRFRCMIVTPAMCGIYLVFFYLTVLLFHFNFLIRYLRDTNTSMAIVDVGLFTGFEPDIDSCERVS